MTHVSRAMLTRIADLEQAGRLQRDMTPIELHTWAKLCRIADEGGPMPHEDGLALVRLFVTLVPPQLRW